MADHTQAGVWRPIPAALHLGIELAEVTEGRARLVLNPGQHLTNGNGVIQGGIIATLADMAMALAVKSTVEAGGTTATVEIKANYLSPGRGRLECEATVLRRGGTLAVAEAVVSDADGGLVVKAMATFAIRRPRPSMPGSGE